MPPRNTFCFKRFSVDQQGCAMKIGTDGVLLGAWCRIDPSQDKAMLDIGTGTGVIALQLAQRTEHTNIMIDAVEIEIDAHAAARQNFKASPWSKRLNAHLAAIQDFTAHSTPDMRYDHIVSNPPWFVDSLASPDSSRTIARHTHSLSYNDLIACCAALLSPAGRISLIVPAGIETEKMIAAAVSRGFTASRLTEVHSTPKSGPKRSLLEFSRIIDPTDITPENHTAESQNTSTAHTTPPVIVIEPDGPGTFSAEYRALTRDFYLYF